VSAASHDPECVAFSDDVAGLALGTLTGVERAKVVEHVQRCPRCARELEELSMTTDELITVIPEAVPPDGFAERTLALVRADRLASPAADGFGDPGAGVDAAGAVVAIDAGRAGGTVAGTDTDAGVTPRRRPVARVWQVAAAVVVLAAGVAIGSVAFSGGGQTTATHAGTGSSVQAVALHSDIGAYGTVVLSSGRYGWLVMGISDVPSSGNVTCMVTLTDGTQRIVGTFPLSHGNGWWAVRLPVPASSVRSVDVFDERGAPVASAQVST